MPSKIYLWIEDREGKASYTFWQTMLQQICPNVILESKKNNSELVKVVKGIEDNNSKYIIVFDNSFDNFQLYQERKLLKKYVRTKKNVFTMDIICFEYILLEFENLIDWIYALDDEFRIKRKTAINAREKLVAAINSDELDYKDIKEVAAYDDNLMEHNIEQLSAKLLFDLTRNTGFEVSKGNIGSCWIESCCEWAKRQDDDICGLDNNRLSLADKMKSIFTGTSLNKEFATIGLEAIL